MQIIYSDSPYFKWTLAVTLRKTPISTNYGSGFALRLLYFSMIIYSMGTIVFFLKFYNWLYNSSLFSSLSNNKEFLMESTVFEDMRLIISIN